MRDVLKSYSLPLSLDIESLKGCLLDALHRICVHDAQKIRILFVKLRQEMVNTGTYTSPNHELLIYPNTRNALPE